MNEVVATFPGVDLIRSAIVPRSLGFIPNPMVLIANPQVTNIPGGGVLTLQFGTQFLVINDVKVDFASLQMTTRGHMMVIRLLDRRWRWKYLPISGRWNVHLADGSIDSTTLLSLRGMAEILLNAMYELNYDVSVLPTDVYPEVDWMYDNAAVQLHRLCEEVGCDIALNWNDTVSIVKLGSGLALPINTDLQDASVKADPPEMPDYCRLVCGETQYQCRLELVAVGLDTDGTIKLIDDLSYTPANGWTAADKAFFDQMLEDGSTEEEVELARKTVYKWYQVKRMADGTLTVPNYGAITDIRQILPINDWKLQTYTSAVGGRKTNIPAEVYGTYFTKKGDPNHDENTDPCTKYEGGFSIDRFNGIVMFDRAVLMQVEPTAGVFTFNEATLYLETSFGVRDSTNGSQVRAYYDFVFNPGGVLCDVVPREEIGLKVRATYVNATSCTAVATTETNETTLAAEANSILNLYVQRYATAIYGSGKYRGLQAINPDGTIRQVIVYADMEKGFNTVASYNTEVGPAIVRAAERRRRRIMHEQSNTNRLMLRNTKLAQRGGFR